MKWEYKTTQFDLRQSLSGSIDHVKLAEELNARGEQGWELVSVVRTTWGPNPALLAVFKRPL